MSGTKHTKGPWRVVGSSVEVGGRIAAANVRAERGRGRNLADVCVAVVLEPEDARLIAAAPDMLEALRLASPLLHGEYDGCSAETQEGEAIARVDAALALAEKVSR